MSGASYAAWAKFDVEKELKRVDEAEQQEKQQRRLQKQAQAKENVESSAVQAAQQSADVLGAQAAVAALKAKKKGRKGRKQDDKDGETIEEEKAKKLQAKADLLAKKQRLLQQVMENRRLGENLLAKESWGDAKSKFKVALTGVQELETLSPELLQVEDHKSEEGPKTNQEPSQEHEHAEKDDSHHCGENCAHEHKKKETKKPVEVLPKANDLLAIIKMFYKDVYMGIGRCNLEERQLAAASEAFKEVLLLDDTHLTAWVKRGETFERMEAPLLAMLHYNRVVNLDSDHDEGKEGLERVKAKLLISGDTSNDKAKILNAVSAYTNDQTLKHILERIDWVFEEANVLAAENFYDYSSAKYQVVLGCIEAVKARPELFTTNEETVSVVLREIEVSCHLNIVNGYLEMHRNFLSGLSHCEQVVQLDSCHPTCYFRMGQLYQALHNYEKALGSFKTAENLLTKGQYDEDQRKKMLTTLAKEIDKCEFDRNQYDIGYLRSLASK